jgi:hypothetical protein
VQRSGEGRTGGRLTEGSAVRRLAGIAFFLYCGLAFFFVIAWGIGSTEFDLPIGPPIFAVASVVLAWAAVIRLARRS